MRGTRLQPGRWRPPGSLELPGDTGALLFEVVAGGARIKHDYVRFVAATG